MEPSFEGAVRGDAAGGRRPPHRPSTLPDLGGRGLPATVEVVPAYRISRAARLLGVSPDTMRRWADAGRVETVSDASGHICVDGTALARLAVELGQEPDRTSRQSLRNRFPGIVTRVLRDGVAAQVEVQAGPHRLVALITREAADELGLEPGMLADGVVKSTSVSIELPVDA